MAARLARGLYLIYNFCSKIKGDEFTKKIYYQLKARRLLSTYNSKFQKCDFIKKRAEIAEKLGGSLSLNDPDLFDKINKRIESVFQQCLAELTWLDSIAAYSNSIASNIDRLDFLINLRESDLNIPTALEPSNIIHLIFSDKIFISYADFRGKDFPYTGCIIRPESILPYPKGIITAAGNHYLMCISYQEHRQYFDRIVATRNSEKIKSIKDLFETAQFLYTDWKRISFL